MQPGGTGLPLYTSQSSEWELRERRERGKRNGGWRPRNWVPRVRDNLCFSPRHPPWRPRKRIRGGRVSFSFVLSFVFSLARFISSWDRPGRRAKGGLQRAAFAWRAGTVCTYLAMIYLGHMRVMNKQNQKPPPGRASGLALARDIGCALYQNALEVPANRRLEGRVYSLRLSKYSQWSAPAPTGGDHVIYNITSLIT